MYHLRRGVGLIKFLENGTRLQPPTSLYMYMMCVRYRTNMNVYGVCRIVWHILYGHTTDLRHVGRHTGDDTSFAAQNMNSYA